MPQLFLHGPNIHATFEQMSREGVAERVARGGFDNPRITGGRTNRSLHAALVNVVTPDLAATRISTGLSGRKYVLPTPRYAGSWVFPFQGVGKIDARRPFGNVPIEQRMAIGDVPFERFNELVGQGHDTVLATFGVAHEKRLVLEIDVLYA